MSTVHDLLELALRLEHVRATPPPPLRINPPRQRDGPRGYRESKPASTRHGAAQRATANIRMELKSKGPST